MEQARAGRVAPQVQREPVLLVQREELVQVDLLVQQVLQVLRVLQVQAAQVDQSALREPLAEQVPLGLAVQLVLLVLLTPGKVNGLQLHPIQLMTALRMMAVAMCV